MAPRLERPVSRRVPGNYPPCRGRRTTHRRREDRARLGDRVPIFIHQTRRASITRSLLQEIGLGGEWHETKERQSAAYQGLGRRCPGWRESAGAESLLG